MLKVVSQRIVISRSVTEIETTNQFSRVISDIIKRTNQLNNTKRDSLSTIKVQERWPEIHVFAMISPFDIFTLLVDMIKIYDGYCP